MSIECQIKVYVYVTLANKKELIVLIIYLLIDKIKVRKNVTL